VKRREAVLISDFQKTGWSGSEDARPRRHDPEDDLGRLGETANLSVPSVSFGRAAFSGQERVTVTAGLSNKVTRR
jgi:hypothetical protein